MLLNFFLAVINHHSMVMLSFCALKLHYSDNYSGMAVNYHSKSFIMLAHGGKYKYYNNVLWYFNPRKSWVNITRVIYRSIIL
jgi:hypothetical protein